MYVKHLQLVDDITCLGLFLSKGGRGEGRWGKVLGNYWVISMRLGGSTVGPKLFYLRSARWIFDVTSMIRITLLDNGNVIKQ